MFNLLETSRRNISGIQRQPKKKTKENKRNHFWPKSQISQTCMHTAKRILPHCSDAKAGAFPGDENSGGPGITSSRGTTSPECLPHRPPPGTTRCLTHRSSDSGPPTRSRAANPPRPHPSTHKRDRPPTAGRLSAALGRPLGEGSALCQDHQVTHFKVPSSFACRRCLASWTSDHSLRNHNREHNLFVKPLLAPAENALNAWTPR